VIEALMIVILLVYRREGFSMKKINLIFLILSMYCFVSYSYADGDDPGYYVSRTKLDHQMSILDSGLASLELRLQMIERAKESIVVEYFIYDLDPSSRIFTQALVKKAREGVKVRILLDFFMTKPEIDAFHIYELAREGVEVKYYNTAPMIRFVKFMYRNHRKLLAIDDKEAIVGGRNIADEYFDMRTDFNFIDKDVYIEGPVVASIMRTFDDYWNHRLSKKPKKPRRPNKNSIKYRRYARSFVNPHARYNPGDRLLRRSLRAFQKDIKRFEDKQSEAEDFITENDEDRALREVTRELGEESLERLSIWQNMFSIK